jgi:hypothetical protein
MARSGDSGCVACRAAVPKTAKFCPSCGTSTTPIGMVELSWDAPDAGQEIRFERGSANGGGRSRRGLVIGGLVTALLVGGAVVVGKSNTKSTTAPSTTSSTTAASTTTTSTTAVSESTTTTIAGPRSIGTGPLLGEPTGLELWIQPTFNGSTSLTTGIYRIDLDAATMTRVANQQTNYQGPPVTATVDGEGLHVFAGDSNVIRRDGTVNARSSIDGNVLAIEPDGIWVVPYGDGMSAPNSIERRRFDGSLVTTISLPKSVYPGLAAGAGRFVLQASDGRQFLFDVETKQLEPLVGSVVAARGGAFVANRCTDDLVCATTYVAADGTEVALDFAFFGWFSNGTASLSPDGRWLVSTPASGNSGSSPVILTVSNPIRGERVDLGVVRMMGYGSAIGAWSPDGRWFFTVTEQGLVAWRPGLAAPIVVPVADGASSADMIAVDMIAVGVVPGSGA